MVIEKHSARFSGVSLTTYTRKPCQNILLQEDISANYRAHACKGLAAALSGFDRQTADGLLAGAIMLAWTSTDE